MKRDIVSTVFKVIAGIAITAVVIVYIDGCDKKQYDAIYQEGYNDGYDVGYDEARQYIKEEYGID